MTDKDPNMIPYREGEPPPEGHILCEMENEDGESLGEFWVRPESVSQSPIRNEDIQGMTPQIRWVWRHLRKHITWCRSFEDWELGFMRDKDPAEETVIWLRATYAYLQLIHENPAKVNREGVFSAVSHLMTGREDLVKPKSAARRLKKLMTKLFPEQIFDLENFTEDGRLLKGDKHLR